MGAAILLSLLPLLAGLSQAAAFGGVSQSSGLYVANINGQNAYAYLYFSMEGTGGGNVTSESIGAFYFTLDAKFDQDTFAGTIMNVAGDNQSCEDNIFGKIGNDGVLTGSTSAGSGCGDPLNGGTVTMSLVTIDSSQSICNVTVAGSNEVRETIGKGVMAARLRNQYNWNIGYVAKLPVFESSECQIISAVSDGDEGYYFYLAGLGLSLYQTDEIMHMSGSQNLEGNFFVNAGSGTTLCSSPALIDSSLVLSVMNGTCTGQNFKNAMVQLV